MHARLTLRRAFSGLLLTVLCVAVTPFAVGAVTHNPALTGGSVLILSDPANTSPPITINIGWPYGPPPQSGTLTVTIENGNDKVDFVGEGENGQQPTAATRSWERDGSDFPSSFQIRAAAVSSAVDDVILNIKHNDSPTGTHSLTVFKVTLSKSGSWSSENSLPNSLHVKNRFSGNTPVINQGQNISNDGATGFSVPIELKAVIAPAGLNLTLSDFNISQSYTITLRKTFTDDRKPSELSDQFQDPPFDDQDLDRDGSGGGDAWYVFDAPGFGDKAPVLQQFQNDGGLSAVEAVFDFTTLPVHKNKPAGSALNWSISVKAVKQQDGSIVFQ